MKEVAKHNSREDCWMIINGKVYDVTSWIDKHPGGEIILSYAGMDATDVFEAFHDNRTNALLPGFYIGECNDYKVSEVLMEHRKMKVELEKQHMFDASPIFYTYKILSNLALLGAGVFCAAYFESSWRVVASAILVALFWQQCGWLAHDFLHHQVFKNRKINHIIGGTIGDVFVGFSICWWNAKHNLHHATPNVAGYDPDIDTLPLLAWSENLIEGDLQKLPPIMLKYQYLFYVPLLSAARLSWAIQSVIWAFTKNPPKQQFFECSGLFIHYVWYLSLIFFCMTWKEAILFLFLSQSAAGVLLACAFTLNHNGMVIYDSGTQAQLEYNKLQITTGRDVTSSFAAWFMGGLNWQIEHHLFPRIPRHNLYKVQKLVIPFCKKWGIPYHQTNFLSGTVETFQKLYSVSSALK
jgi:fatty acid desaturase/predicted heme/steroid binding protein